MVPPEIGHVTNQDSYFGPKGVCIREVSLDTVESSYQAHALIGITVKRYALHNEVGQIAGVKFDHASKSDIIG